MNSVYVIDYIYKLPLIDFSQVSILNLLNVHPITDGNIRGHAYGVISKIVEVNPNVKIIFIPINLTSTSEDIIYILNYILQNGNGSIINLSFGFKNIHFMNELHELIKKLINKGMYIICSDGNINDVVYPAHFKEVITINSSKFNKNSIDINNNIIFLDRSLFLKVLWIDNKCFYTSDSSFYTALASGVASLMNSKDFDLASLYKNIIERTKLNVQ
ncbi:MAG: S8/S53 family peptidase [Tissierellia bacterium]|nr:S8/S53 family peptidase [Tissierellia bacterium]